jgi:hypothetical protein
MRDIALSRPSDPAGAAKGKVSRHLQYQTLVSYLSRTLYPLGHDYLGHCSLRLLAAELPLLDHCQKKGQDCRWYVIELLVVQGYY